MNISKIKDLRIKSNLTQKELSLKIGLNNTLYNKYENNYNTIPLIHLNTICNFFNVSIDYIFSNNKIENYQKSYPKIDKIICGKRLKEFRKEQKLTQTNLAIFLNTTHSVIADYEKGRFLISTSFLYAICKKFNISADYLLGKIDKPKYL